MTGFSTLASLATVALGYKSLQNEFFYLNTETISTYGIEERFLRPIFTLRDLDGASYTQKPTVKYFLFECREKEPDLRGTGALTYIHAMAGAAATLKKQSGVAKTIRQVLTAQGGGLWYSPKAKPHPANIWLRKAVDTVYAPFLFPDGAVIDQRCNYIEPIGDLPWPLLAAVLTSSAFAYSVEINGSASMGAGALEAPTTKLRGYPVFDPRPLPAEQRSKLIRLAEAVWEQEKPVNWADDSSTPGPSLRELDEYIIDLAGKPIDTDALYGDLRAACRSRILVAKDKVRTTKKKKADSIGAVAQGIADTVARLLAARQFPEHFVSTPETVHIRVPKDAVRRIIFMPLMGNADVRFLGPGNNPLWEGTYDVPVAETIVRAVLLGRETFDAPAKRGDATVALNSFFVWFDEIDERIKRATDESALGTGYEAALRAQVFGKLGVSPLAGERTLPHEINLTVAS